MDAHPIHLGSSTSTGCPDRVNRAYRCEHILMAATRRTSCCFEIGCECALGCCRHAAHMASLHLSCSVGLFMQRLKEPLRMVQKRRLLKDSIWRCRRWQYRDEASLAKGVRLQPGASRPSCRARIATQSLIFALACWSSTNSILKCERLLRPRRMAH